MNADSEDAPSVFAYHVWFGLPFPAKDVLAEVRTSVSRYPLQPLPAHLAYTGVEVFPQALRISLSGRDIDFGRGMLAGTGCRS